MPSLKTSAFLVATGLGAALASKEWLARRSEEDLTGQVALVTGGSRGLGYLIARELAREGCRVAICARDEAELTRAAASLEGQGAEVLALRCDVGDRADVARAVDEAERQFGPIDILVNNAGIIQAGPVAAMTHEDFARAMDVMYWGVVNPTLALLPRMRERRRGRIANITSIGGKVAVPHLLPYCAAKFAATGFSEGLRAELAGSGISVTTIAPGLMRTGSYVNATFKGRQDQEFTWFSLGDALPVTSMDAERAARQIVRAVKRREVERVLTVPATLLARAHGLAPGLTSSVMAIANRFVLPSAEGGTSEPARGESVQRQSPSKLRDALTAWGRDAAERFHEYPGATSVPVEAGGADGSASVESHRT
jgi:NAD(P)-dependent dehydrogenase (short-subunit alcohol dehydrogenase family)